MQMPALRIRHLLCAMAALGGAGALAQPLEPTPRWWINAGFYTHHFDANAGLQNENPGLGLEWSRDDSYALTGGVFTNSDRQTSHYLGLYVTPVHWAQGHWGVVAGAFDGYPHAFGGSWFPAVLPIVKWEGAAWGLHVAYIPTLPDRLYGGLAFQLKFAIR